MNMKRKQKENTSTTAFLPVYLNTPVTEQKNDIIGFDTCASALEDAINKGAQMIAITSPFGAGKTSVIELLKEKRKSKSRCKDRRKEQIIHIPMWSQISQGEISSTDLHKHLVYQIAKEINAKKGTYIRRRLSENYGLVKVHINRKRYLIIGALAIALWFLGGFIQDQTEFLTDIFPYMVDYFPIINILMKAIGGIFAIYSILKSEIIISSPKSEKNRKIEEDEIIDLYRNEISQPYKCFCPWCKHRYIIVIEDIDRSNSNSTVLSFLKELRKYYMPEGQQNKKVRNEIVYIVNIKPESLLILNDENTQEDETGIFAKIFDFVLNIQTINIDEYETILNSELEKQKDSFVKIGIIDADYKGKMSDIVGMQWLIRGRKLGIREIKHRINRAVIAYQSLKERFGDDISFEKCAVYAYLSTEYENDFQTIDDKAFDKLTEMRIEGLIDVEDCINAGIDQSDDFINAICELINSKHIDSSYKMYFYNHPKGSRIFTSDEKYIRDAILYEEYDSKLNDIVKNVIESKSDIIKLSLYKRKQLNLHVSRAVFSSDLLFGEAIHYVPTSIVEWMDGQNYSKTEETIKTIIKVLHLDAERRYYNDDMAKKFCLTWKTNSDATSFISELRKAICIDFSNEIMWYKPLFFSPNAPISSDEYKLIPFNNAVELVDVSSNDITVSDFSHLLDAYEEQNSPDLYAEKVQLILDKAINKYTDTEMAYVLLRYMKKAKRIVPTYEDIIIDNMNQDNITEDPIFIEYQELVNMLADSQLPDETLNNISRLQYYSGYSESVIEQLHEKEFVIDAAIMLMKLNKQAPYDELSFVEGIRARKDWLKETGWFEQVRYHIACCTKNILQYSFMFEKTDPVMSTDEFFVLKSKISAIEMFRLIHTQLVDYSLADTLVEYWNSMILSKEQTFQILIFISTMKPEVAKSSIEQLDFTKRFHYYNLTKPQRDQVKNSFTNILKLNVLENRLGYMGLTRYADSEWITQDSKEIIGNENLELSFVNILNCCYPHSITKPVLHVFRQLNGEFATTEQIEKKLIENNMYKKYIESRILRLNILEFENLKTTDPLWHIYVELFVKTTNTKILACYASDIPFLTITMAHKYYANLPEAKRIYYTKINQDAECLTELVQNYNQDFVLLYLSEINGFVDFEAASVFIEIVEKNEFILASNEVYQNTHHKLINSSLKGKYTKKRNENSYN